MNAGRGWWAITLALLAFVFAFSLAPLPASSQERPGGRVVIPDSVRGGGRAIVRQRIMRHIERAQREKRSWTPRQRKIHPKLLMENKRRRGQRVVGAVPQRSRVAVDPNGMTMVDIRGNVTPDLIRRIESMGGEIVNQHPKYGAIRARIPIVQTEELADSADVRQIRPAERFINRLPDTSEGDVAHRAAPARLQFGVDGSGKKACVVSDSIEALAGLQTLGDLPAVDVLPGQSGSGTSEGTALLEIVHDLAPGAALGYATANGGQPQFAQNIIDLRNQLNCDVIVDDIFYFFEPAFQDGPIAAAVDQVVADGALYFSSAGNGGNLNDGRSGVWEGDFNDIGDGSHDFGGGLNGNAITDDPPVLITLQWSDPQGGSANDYDLFLFDPTGTTLFDSSQAVQDGIQDPIEAIDSQPFNDVGNLLVVVQFLGADRMIHLNTHRGELGLATTGQITGHTGARSAIAVAAVNVATAGGGAFTGGPGNPVETFSSDGPRRVHFEANGTAITPGNFSSTGGEVRQKPEIAAADGVSVATPDFSPFFGTSAAAPHAAAIATLALSLPTNPGPIAVRDAMFNTALDIEMPGFDRDSGHGIVDAVNALGALALPDLIAEWVKLKPASCPGGQGQPAIVYQSSIGDHDSPTSGSSVFQSQFVGARFTLNKTETVTRIGARFFPVPTPPGGTIFGALVDLNSSPFPSNTPLTIDPDKLIASTVFTPTYGADFLTPLSATIGPGTYGLVFGSGLYGATGSQAITRAQPPFTGSGTIIMSPPQLWQETGGVNAERILVEAQDPAPPDAQTGATECRFKGRLAVANTGIANAAASTARIFYSGDTTLDPTGDIQLAEFSVSALAVNQVQVNPVKLSVPGVTDINPDSTVYIQLDVNGAVSELDETNNIEDAGGF